MVRQYPDEVYRRQMEQKNQMKKLNMRGTVMGMAASKHCAKPDPVNFQTKLISRYQHKLVSLLQETENRVAQ
jgi:hypothetical protein